MMKRKPAMKKKVSEYGGMEKYKSAAARKKHEKKESWREEVKEKAMAKKKAKKKPMKKK